MDSDADTLRFVAYTTFAFWCLTFGLMCLMKMDTDNKMTKIAQSASERMQALERRVFALATPPETFDDSRLRTRLAKLEDDAKERTETIASMSERIAVINRARRAERELADLEFERKRKRVWYRRP